MRTPNEQVSGATGCVNGLLISMLLWIPLIAAILWLL